MKYIIKWCDWELKNEFMTSGYFCVMVFSYGIVELLYGRSQVNIWVLFEMFLLNYVISTVQKLVLSENKEYTTKEYYRKVIILIIASFVAIVFTCHFFGWFKGSSIYAELFMYITVICSYLYVWMWMRWMKKRDTKELNEQLDRFKEKQKKQ